MSAPPKPSKLTSSVAGHSFAPVSLLGAYYVDQTGTGSVICALCGYEMEWTSCGACGGEGWHDATEDDPMMYAPGDTKPCPECDGKGGAWFCETITCKTIEGTLEIKAPNDKIQP